MSSAQPAALATTFVPREKCTSDQIDDFSSTGPTPIILVVMLLLLGNVGNARAATIVMDGVTCTLPEAITAANTNAPFGGCSAGDDRIAGGDIIRLAADVVLTSVNNTDDAGCENGLPVISSKIKIAGNRHAIVRADDAPAFRLIDSRPGTLILEDVTLNNGLSHFGCSGTGINGSNVTLIGCTVSHNHGGGYGSVEKIEGAGIAATSLTLTRTTVSDNDGQGIGVIGSMFMSRSTVTRNTWLFGTFTAGGGLAVIGTAVIEDSTISDNDALDMAGVGGGLYVDGSVILTNTTVSGNYAAGEYGIGGGLFLYHGSATLINSTVSGNTAHGCNSCWGAGGSGGGIYSAGSGMEQGPGASISLIHSTVAGNAGYVLPGGLITTFALGAGVNSYTLNVTNSIVANNTSSVPYATDCFATDVHYFGVSLIGDGNNCGATSSGQLSGDPLLGPLADYGGATAIQPLLPGSPAIDRIAFTPGTGCNPTNVTTDQRGVARPQSTGGNCDIGAIEYTGFPVKPVLDNFNRPDGTLGSSWSGASTKAAYRLQGNQIDVRNGGPLYWAPSKFGIDQEAYVTLARIDPNGEHTLLLKVQGDSPGYALGEIEVLYDSRAHVVKVETLLPGRTAWTIYTDIPATFQDGDQFGGRVYSNGNVAVYRNNVLLATVKLNGRDQQFFNQRGGSIGLWFDNAQNAIFDSFGGGTVNRD